MSIAARVRATWETGTDVQQFSLNAHRAFDEPPPGLFVDDFDRDNDRLGWCRETSIESSSESQRCAASALLDFFMLLSPPGLPYLYM
jgi:hypothetical protein